MAAPASTSGPVVRGVSVQGVKPLGDVAVASFRYRETLGAPFEAVLDLRSDTPDADLGDLLGKPVTVTVPLPNGGDRHFSGICFEAEQNAALGDVFGYRLTLVSWMRILELGSDCRIYQEKSVKDIVTAVCDGLGFTDSKMSGIVGSMPPLPYCVQYRETNGNFVHRLIERFGIWYLTEHERGSHTIAFADSNVSAKPFPGYERIPYAASDAEAASQEHIHAWRSKQRMETGKVTLKDYTYTDPKSELEVQDTASHPYPHGDLERFEYPGLYTQKSDGQQLVEIRMGEHAARESVVTGEARCYGLSAGSKFTLEGHPRADQNASYLVTAIDFLLTAEAAGDRHGGSAGAFACTCGFEAIPADVDYRPPRKTPVPRIAGHHTARVVGPTGQDPKTPYTNEQGCIRVQFPWDRYGQDNEKSSCWIRYHQIAAGPGWGAVFVPRIGCEVTVVFEGGDPDRPLAIGSLYNQDNKPPLSLPGEAKTFAIQDDGGNYLTLQPDEGNQVVTFYSPTDNTTLKVGKTG